MFSEVPFLEDIPEFFGFVRIVRIDRHHNLGFMILLLISAGFSSSEGLSVEEHVNLSLKNPET